jgi:squalene-hopene/tetraprenyl-beta-curcumene cyclase
MGLQNRDGGFPTFCKGWGTLPFDRSAPDITAHCIRAIHASVRSEFGYVITQGKGMAWDIPEEAFESANAVVAGFQYLQKTQRADGSWLPLWFGNQHAPNDENPTYGTSRVLAAYRDARDKTNPIALRGVQWLKDNQNPDGGWGGVKGTPSSVEETALAVEILLSWEPDGTHTGRGLEWLMDRVEDGSYRETSPIGFYFAKLWYFEELYPLIFTVGCLRQAVRALKPDSLPHRQPTRPPALVSQPSVADGTFRT